MANAGLSAISRYAANNAANTGDPSQKTSGQAKTPDVPAFLLYRESHARPIMIAQPGIRPVGRVRLQRRAAEVHRKGGFVP
jgi:hypothetical protein